jgi:tetratricopeptide (TPR) repeat protein
MRPVRRALAAAGLAAFFVLPASAAPVQVKESGGKVLLRNEFLEVEVAPRGGMYVTRARDLTAGVDICTDLKLNFPFFEHGIKADQPAGYRVVRGPGGSATVAMNMRFGHHRAPADIQRYGRFSERGLSELVTVRPGSAALEWHGRVDNPTPLRRSERLWDRALMPAPAETVFLMPAAYGIEHNALWIKSWPRWAEADPATGATTEVDASLRANWRRGRPTQYFGLWPKHGFAGACYPFEQVNRLRISDPQRDPGMKFYCSGDTFELWGGTTVVFESPGGLLDGYVPTEFRKWFYAVRGIGRVHWADGFVAVHAATGPEPLVQVTGPRPMESVAVVVLDERGHTVAWERGAIGPGRAITVKPPRPLEKVRVVVQQQEPHAVPGADGKPVLIPHAAMLLDKTFPLPIPDNGDLYQKARQECNHGGVRPDFIEADEYPHHHSPGALAATKAAQTLLKTGPPDVRAAESLAYACYRIGDFTSAVALANRVRESDAASAHASHVLGLVAYEEGRFAEAGPLLEKAGVQANYLRALMAHAAGREDEARGLLDELVRLRPNVYRPRMLLAVLEARAGRKDTALGVADALVGEDPASPEACEVLRRVAEIAGKAEVAAEAAEARDALLQENPDAPRQFGLFVKELDQGRWTYPARYTQDLPQP